MNYSIAIMSLVFVIVALASVLTNRMELHQMMTVVLLANILITLNNIKRVDTK